MCTWRIHMITGTAVAILPTSVSFCMIFLMRPCLRAQHRMSSVWGDFTQKKLPNYQQTSAVTHGWKTHVVFSFLSRHFGPSNTRLRVTFWLIWQFCVWRSICLPFTGSPASEVKKAEKWRWSSRRPRPQTHAYVMNCVFFNQINVFCLFSNIRWLCMICYILITAMDTFHILLLRFIKTSANLYARNVLFL